MKQFRLLSYLFVAVLCFGFVSCSDDDDDDKNVLTYLSKSYSIGSGEIYNFEDTNFDIHLYSKGYTENDGQEMWIELWSSSLEELSNGTYTYKTYPGTAGKFTNLEIYDQKTESEMSFTNATVTINKSGDIYEIIVEGKDSENNKLYAYYRGTLKYYLGNDE